MNVTVKYRWFFFSIVFTSKQGISYVYTLKHVLLWKSFWWPWNLESQNTTLHKQLQNAMFRKSYDISKSSEQRTQWHISQNYKILQNRKTFEKTQNFTKHNILKSKTYFIKLCYCCKAQEFTNILNIDRFRGKTFYGWSIAGRQPATCFLERQMADWLNV